MTLQDFIRQRLIVENGASLQIVRLPDGRFQANVQRGRTNAFTHEIHDDPVDALWNAIAPHQMRRPGSAVPAFQETTRPPAVGAQIDLEEAIAATEVDKFEDLLG